MKEEQENQGSGEDGSMVQESGGEQVEESMKERGMMVLLDKLELDESKLQKAIMFKKSKSGQKSLDGRQKPW